MQTGIEISGVWTKVWDIDCVKQIVGLMKQTPGLVKTSCSSGLVTVYNTYIFDIDMRMLARNIVDVTWYTSSVVCSVLCSLSFRDPHNTSCLSFIIMLIPQSGQNVRVNYICSMQVLNIDLPSFQHMATALKIYGIVFVCFLGTICAVSGNTNYTCTTKNFAWLILNRFKIWRFHSNDI